MDLTRVPGAAKGEKVDNIEERHLFRENLLVEGHPHGAEVPEVEQCAHYVLQTVHT